MKPFSKFLRTAVLTAAAIFAGLSARAQLTGVDIFPPLMDPAPLAGSYTPGVGGAFSITGSGTSYPGNMDFGSAGLPRDINETGDVMTFAYEQITGDFDRVVRISAIAGEPAVPVDRWARGGLMVRTGLKHYNASLQLQAANPASGGGNEALFLGRGLDGQNYGEFSRHYTGVAKAIPNQWLRLRRVGDYFAAYVGKDGINWTLVGERFQEWPAEVYVGAYAAAGTTDTQAIVGFASYGAPTVNDVIPPRVVSAGTIDKAVVGVRFSEMIASATALTKANYKLSEGTVTDVKMGIGGDAVYLTVTGLTADNFSVTVLGGIKDTAGNLIAANSVVQARALNWVAQDIGAIQNPGNRPTVGDDPYRVGRSVMVSSDENPEIEVVGGGSNQWDPGDFIHYIYRADHLSGDFDVTVAVSRFDRSNPQGGYSNSGIMLRAAPYLEGEEYTIAGTKVPMVANPTYIENSAPGRGAIPLWRLAAGGNYGVGRADYSWTTLIGGIKGYYSGLRGTDASGTLDPKSSATSARYLRIRRVLKVYTFYASWDGANWAQVDKATLNLPDKLLLGFSTMTDSGAFATPFSAYGNNGHMIDLDDPLNPLNPLLDPPAPGGRSYMNEANYAVQRIKVFPHGVPAPVPVDLEVVDIAAEDGSSAALAGTYKSTGTYSFEIDGGGTAAFRNAGDELTYAYESVTGDFDKQARIASITTSLFNNDGSPYVPLEEELPPIDTWAHGGLMVRSATNDYSASLEIVAANPAGANELRVMGRGLDGQNYTMFSRSYGGVTNVLPNQWIRIQRVGNYFAFYAGTNGVLWSLVGQRYQELPATVLIGGYAASSLNPDDATGNPLALKARTLVRFEDYKNVDLGDKVPPALVSAGTLDKKTVGVKFSEPVSSATATLKDNYKLSQGTVSDARIGIGGDSVYLAVTGLTVDSFTVTVDNVKDPAGNLIAPGSVAQGKVSGWTSTDIGLIQAPNARPTPGDDPYRAGQAVAVSSSDDGTEVEIIGGGSNDWNNGDYIHYLYAKDALVGDFDVAVAVARLDRQANTAGYSHSGLMLRAAIYNAGLEFTPEGTKMPMVANTTYIENSAPGRGAIPLWRLDAGGGYFAGNANFSWQTVIGGLKGYFGDLRAIDSGGTPDPQSSPSAARWLRIQRTGNTFVFSASWDGATWTKVDQSDLALPNTLLLGVSTMNDTGANIPPGNAYGGNGHSLDPNDPLAGHQNESNYSVERVRLYPKGPPEGGVPGPLTINRAGETVTISWPGAGTLESSTGLSGGWSPVDNPSNPYVINNPQDTRYYRLSR